MITHKLNVDPRFKPVKQKRRKFTPDRNRVVNEEVEKLFSIVSVRKSNI